MERHHSHRPNHAQHSTIPSLERTEGEAVRLLKETTVTYFMEVPMWRAEMLLLDEATSSQKPT